MRLGDRGRRVVRLQTFLINLGYMFAYEENYGPATKVAVLRLQEKLGFIPTGIWTEDLAAILLARGGMEGEIDG